MQLNKIVITHGHPDHFGQDGFFNMSATHYFNTFKYSGNSMFMPITYDVSGGYQWKLKRIFQSFQKSTGAYQLTPNVQLWQTPGHTPQDISVIVNNVPSMGTVAIVGMTVTYCIRNTL
jgi:glyoxylase-like metal-dependent hydrolase (beta-lactamase superfamily II)